MCGGRSLPPENYGEWGGSLPKKICKSDGVAIWLKEAPLMCMVVQISTGIHYKPFFIPLPPTGYFSVLALRNCLLHVMVHTHFLFDKKSFFDYLLSLTF